MLSVVFGSVNNNEVFTNNGAITISTSGAFTVGGARFDQNGTVDGPGTLSLVGTIANFPGDLSNAVTGLSLQDTTLNLFTNAGAVTVGPFAALLVTGGYSQSAGQTLLNSGALTAGGLLGLEGGVLAGSGTISASVLNNAEIDVGAPGIPGTLTVNGDYTQTATAILVLEIGGPSPGTDFDQLNITGQATLDGTLTVNVIKGFQPNSGDGFAVLTFGSGAGAFANLTGDGPAFTPRFDPTDVTLVAN